jgi:hypothetical protein
MNPLGFILKPGLHVAVHGRTIVDVIQLTTDQGGVMKLSAVFVSLEAIRTFVRDVLGCQCPESVFADVRIGLPTLYGTHKAENGLEFLIGSRLLVAVVPLSEIGEPTTEIPSILEVGRRTRDLHGLNRFRLVVVGVYDDEMRAKIETLALTLGDRLHLHLLDYGTLRRCGLGLQPN